MGWVEDLAASLYAATGGDLDALAELLPTRVHPAPGAAGFGLRWSDTDWDLWVPTDRAGALHEWGHRACHVGLGCHMRRTGAAFWRRECGREESQAERFRAAWQALDD